jgi:DNA-binding GntR family transcriptional regulator
MFFATRGALPVQVRNKSELKKMLPKKLEPTYEEIKTKILSGFYQPGQALGEIPLATEYGINRARIRQIFHHLEGETLVVRIPNRGTFVKSITSKDLQDIFEMREALEGMAARLAARRRKDEPLEEMIALFAEHEETSTDNLMEKIKLSEHLHQFILKSCGNSKICDAIEPLRVHIMRTWKGGLIIPDRINRAFKEHIEILQALKEKNEDVAERRMKEHIVGAFRDYIKTTILNE